MSLKMKNFDKVKILQAIDLVVCNSKRMTTYSKDNPLYFTNAAVEFIDEQSKAICEMAKTMKIFINSIEELTEVNDQLNHIINLNKVINDAGVKPG